MVNAAGCCGALLPKANQRPLLMETPSLGFIPEGKEIQRVTQQITTPLITLARTTCMAPLVATILGNTEEPCYLWTRKYVFHVDVPGQTINP